MSNGTDEFPAFDTSGLDYLRPACWDSSNQNLANAVLVKLSFAKLQKIRARRYGASHVQDQLWIVDLLFSSSSLDRFSRLPPVRSARADRRLRLLTCE